MWIKCIPQILLVLSVVSFGIGLVSFTYSRGQHNTVCTVVTVSAACSMIGFIIMLIWLILERGAYRRYKSQFWSQVQSNDTLINFTKMILRSTSLERTAHYITRASVCTGDQACKLYHAATHRDLRCLGASSDTDVESISSQSTTDPRSAINRLRSVVHSAMIARGAASASTVPQNSILPKLQPTLSPGNALPSAATSPPRNPQPEPFTSGRLVRLEALKPSLKNFAPAHNIVAHQALVRHLAFSPNGKFLATCSWDRTSIIIKVADLSSHRVLAHPQGFVGQVMWSPNGSLLLTKLTNGIKVWTEDGVCMQSVERPTAVHSVAWFSSGTEFLSIESNEAVHLDL